MVTPPHMVLCIGKTDAIIRVGEGVLIYFVSKLAHCALLTPKDPDFQVSKDFLDNMFILIFHVMLWFWGFPLPTDYRRATQHATEQLWPSYLSDPHTLHIYPFVPPDYICLVLFTPQNMEIKLLSLTVKGLNNTTMRVAILSFLEHAQGDICLLQETHLLAHDTFRMHSRRVPHQIWSSAWGKRGRVPMRFSRCFQGVILGTCQEVKGRLLAVRVQKGTFR